MRHFTVGSFLLTCLISAAAFVLLGIVLANNVFAAPAKPAVQQLPVYNYDSRGYTLECCPNGYAVYDGNRLVNVIKYGTCKPLDKIVDNDNQ